MKSKILTLLLLALFTRGADATTKSLAKKKVALAVVPVDSVFHFNTQPLPAEARIFLVAGSSLSASFAREVIEQKKQWLRAGFHENEIACYYIVPLQEDLNENQKQFLEVAGELSKCYPATAKLLRQHFKAIGQSDVKPKFIYLYVSSHGDKPVTYTRDEMKSTDDDYWSIQRDAKYPAFDQYHLLIEGLADGTATAPEVLGAMRSGVDPADLYLTPKYLKASLQEYFAEIPKFIVLQGCYSGGFIEEVTPRFTADLLTSLSKITVLTAARHDRTSFGCEPGGETTFFGGTYNQVLSTYIADPRAIPWPKLFGSVQTAVTKLEKNENMDPPSLPQFFSNWRPEN